MMDKIILAGIEFYAYGGVSPAEKEIGQRYRANVELRLDLRAAASSDDVDDTVSYADVFSAVVDTARERPFNLIESLAGRMVDRLLAQFPVQGVTIELQKLLPPLDGVVTHTAVQVTRERTEALDDWEGDG